VALVAAAERPWPRKLRVGVFADSELQPRWLVDAFARVAGSEFAAVTVLAVLGGPRPRLPWPLTAYARLDQAAFGAVHCELATAIRRVPHERYLTAATSQRLAAFDLDVAFALGEVDDLALEGAARYGVWRFCIGEMQGCDAIPLGGFHEQARGEPLTGSALTVRLPGDAARVAYRSWSRTFPYSLARNRAQLLPKAAEFAYRALRELHRFGPGWLHACPTHRPAAAARAEAYRNPIVELAAIGGRVLKRACARAAFIEQWFLAFRFGADADSIPDDLAGYTRVVPPKDRDWADPFVVERDGRYYVFFEELPYAEGKAHISMIEVRRDGSWSRPLRVLERGYHLSYPFLLEHEGRLYMIPESADNRSVELYRCVDFPLRWRLEKVLLEGVRCADATLHRAADRWWMFANVAPGDSPSFDDELHLFHARDLAGDWRPHPRNPVVSDPRCSRPAGRLYRRGGALYRPAQICVPRYGAGLSLNRVERLTAEDYRERPVRRVLLAAHAGLHGLHTVNRAGEVTVVDAFARRWRV
jgi:hypothetical protein